MKQLGLLAVSLMVSAGIVSGCGMKPRLYAVDRPRVDQAQMGNAGYIGGEKKDVESPQSRSTRRIYVFEFNKKKEQETENQENKDVAANAGTVAAIAPPGTNGVPEKKVITIPYIGDEEFQSADSPQGAVDGMLYTVLKDDTLQKISKKVYGTFGKWTKIYDANKDKIKNPNFVKPGTVLVIPPID